MRPLSLLAVLLLLGACGDKDEQQPDPGYESDPNDPVICVGDPDTSIVCKKKSEFWDCSKLPSGETKCKHKDDVVPDGTSSWTCKREGTKVICTTDTPDAGPPGDGDWSCKNEGKGTRCEREAPVPPGGGTWSCGYDKEFSWSCTGSGTTPPTTPPTDGKKFCYQPGGSTGLPTPPEGAWATITAKKVIYKQTDALYVRVAFSKAFVDNTYGANTVGWPDNKHSFKDLVGSDKAEVFFNNANGDLLMRMAIDYISEDKTKTSGYGCLGVEDGDGKLITGDAADVLAAQSSLSVNFNQHGCVETTDSPPTDKSYSPSKSCPKWIYDVYYEVWIKWSVFGKEGPGKVYITGIHASPSKLDSNTLKVTPFPCP